MLTSQIDYNVIADIVRMKESVKQSVEGVMDGSLTAAHLASEVYTLLEQLDKLEVIWRGTPPSEETAPAAQPQQPAPEPPPVEQPVQEPPAQQPQPEQPVQETPPVEQPQPEQPVQEPPAKEQPQPEQSEQENQEQEEQDTEEV